MLSTIWSSPWNPSILWVWELVEVVGAIVVTTGVAGEYIANFTKWVKGKARKKVWEKRSTLILIIGLAVELVGLVNTLVASNLEIQQFRSANLGLQKQVLELKKQIAETSTNVAKVTHDIGGIEAAALVTSNGVLTLFTNLANVDPLNQPIASVSAVVSLATAGVGTNVVNIDRILTPGFVTLQWGRPEEVRFCRSLLCSRWDRFSPDNWSLKFDQGTATFFAQNSFVRDAKKWNRIVIFARFLPRGTEIVGGIVRITINTTDMAFEIPPQEVKGRKEDWENFANNPTNSVTVFGE